MGFPRGPALDPESAADRLADAAITVIARDGFDALSVRAVAREASLTGGTVQHHFPTRAELVAGILDRTLRRQAIRVVTASRAGGDPLERMIAGLLALVPDDGAGREEAIAWVAMSASVPGSTFVAERHREAAANLHRWLTTSIERAQRDGALCAELDPVEVARELEAALDGVLLQAVTDPDARPEVLTRRLRAMIIALVGARESGM
jgi:AcrR family transcriptional regulator